MLASHCSGMTHCCETRCTSMCFDKFRWSIKESSLNANWWHADQTQKQLIIEYKRKSIVPTGWASTVEIWPGSFHRLPSTILFSGRLVGPCMGSFGDTTFSHRPSINTLLVFLLLSIIITTILMHAHFQDVQRKWVLRVNLTNQQQNWCSVPGTLISKLSKLATQCSNNNKLFHCLHNYYLPYQLMLLQQTIAYSSWQLK